MLGIRSPQEVQSLVAVPFVFLLVVHSAEEHSFVSQLRENTSVGIRVAECIDIPANSGSEAEFLLQELVTNHHIVYNIIKVRSCFVISAPPSIDNIKLFILNKLLNLLLNLICLRVIPHGEETHLSIAEPPFGVVVQFFDH